MRSSRDLLFALAVLAGCAASDGAREAAGSAGSQKGEPVNPEIPVLPPGSAQPSSTELASLLERGFPAADAARARRLLLDEILPWDLRSVAGHPNARRLIELVYAGIADELRALAPAARWGRLEEMACDRAAEMLLERSVSLAVARYVRDRGAPTRPGLEGYLTPARAYLAMTAAQLVAAADEVATAWDRWTARAKRFASCAARHRLDELHGRTALGSSRSGSFASASGPFHAFLLQAGEHPQLLDVH